MLLRTIILAAFLTLWLTGQGIVTLGWVRNVKRTLRDWWN